MLVVVVLFLQLFLVLRVLVAAVVIEVEVVEALIGSLAFWLRRGLLVVGEEVVLVRVR